MDNEDKDIAVMVYAFFGFAIWLVALFAAPVFTLILTGGAVLFGGLLSTSGDGDGREN